MTETLNEWTLSAKRNGGIKSKNKNNVRKKP